MRLEKRLCEIMKKHISLLLLNLIAVFELTACNSDIAGMEYTIEEYGSYPQSLVEDSNTTAELDKLCSIYDETGYISGDWEFINYSNTNVDGGSAWARTNIKCRYREPISHGGKQYLAVFYMYREGVHSSGMTYVGADGKVYEDSKIYYFEYEPIRWDVFHLSGGVDRYVTHDLIDFVPYGSKLDGKGNVMGYYGSYIETMFGGWFKDDETVMEREIDLESRYVKGEGRKNCNDDVPGGKYTTTTYIPSYNELCALYGTRRHSKLFTYDKIFLNNTKDRTDLVKFIDETVIEVSHYLTRDLVIEGEENHESIMACYLDGWYDSEDPDNIYQGSLLATNSDMTPITEPITDYNSSGVVVAFDRMTEPQVEAELPLWAKLMITLGGAAIAVGLGLIIAKIVNKKDE